jgi:hypothetical protein
VSDPWSWDFLLGCEIRQLAREIADAFQELCIVRSLAEACDRRRGVGLDDAICEGRSVQPDLGHTGESSLNVGV